MIATTNQEYVVYRHTCIVTNKSYIGQTKNLKNRTIAHRKMSSGCIAFRNAIQKYGWDNFVTDILAKNLTLKQANELEPKFISECATLAPRGYNLTPGGLNYTRSEEHRRKISESNKGKRRPKSAEHRSKISQSLQGRKCSAETIQKRRDKTTGVPQNPVYVQHRALVNTGKKRTDTQRQRMSDAQKGKVQTEETKQKRIAKLTGLVRTQVTCPHCGTVGGGGAMKQWHFDKCKHNPKEIS